MPVLLVGAELFFAGSKSCQSAVQKATWRQISRTRRVGEGHDLSD
jgi:hypothetical protein